MTEPAGPAVQQIALGGRDGERALELLRKAKRLGVAALGTVCAPAIRRLLPKDKPLDSKRLFTKAERHQLTDAVVATIATANLLGRARIRLRQEQAERHYARKASSFTEEPTDFRAFMGEPALHPMAPRQAVAYFRRLVPRLGTDPGRFGDLMQREAFTLAVATEETLLAKVQEIIASRLETGEGIGTAPEDIQAVLDQVGVSPRSPVYATMTFRTNMKDAYAQGAEEELQEPDVQEAFPVWRYVGIRDGRQRPSHEAHFDKYYSSDTPFTLVRGLGPEDVCNDRCDFIPIYKDDWRELQKQGVRVEKFGEGD